MVGQNRDWARVSGHRAIMQKLALFFSIPKGELINCPDVGCSLQSRLGDKLTNMSLIEIGMELEYDLQKQIPELYVHSVRAERGSDESKSEVRLTIDCPLGLMVLGVNREELLDMNLIESFAEYNEA